MIDGFRFKFRAWDTKNKNMIYDFCHEIPEIYKMKLGYPIHDLVYSIGLRYQTLTQCTGLKDKNGKLIYEGDIYHLGDANIIYKVIYRDDQFIGNQIGNKSLAGLHYWIKDIKIIGNIYENPGLLKQNATKFQKIYKGME